MSTRNNANIVIVGCGLSGLCLAQALKQKDIPFHLYEADESAETRSQGYRITVDERGIRALESCLPERLFELFEATASPPGGYFRVLRGDLREIFSLSFFPKKDGVDRYLPRQVDRAILREILFSGLESHISFGKACESIETTSTGAILKFADGTSTGATLIIGADGANSQVRKFVGQEEPESLNAFGIYGRTPSSETMPLSQLIPVRLKDSGVLAVGPPGTAFFFTTMEFKQQPSKAFVRFNVDRSAVHRPDYMMWAIAVTPSEGADFPKERRGLSLHNIALKLVCDFDPVFQRFVQHADPEETMLVPIRISSNATSWSQPNVTLMGDALHLMSPFGGSGGNTALQDAALLAEKLDAAWNKEHELGSELLAYQSEVLQYGLRQIRSGKRMTRVLLSRNVLLRFFLLRVVPFFNSLIRRNKQV